MYEELAPLDNAQLEIFFREREEWNVRDPLPDTTWQVAAFHIYPNLRNGYAVYGGEFATDFQRRLDAYARPKGGDNWMNVIDEIIEAMFKPCNFKYSSIPESIRYFSLPAANHVNTLLIQDKKANRHSPILPDIPDEESIRVPSSMFGRMGLQTDAHEILGNQKGDKWLVLVLLKDLADYTWKEIVEAFEDTRQVCTQEKSVEEIFEALRTNKKWANEGQTAQTIDQPPRHPCFVWQDLIKHFVLPGWFPLHPATCTDDGVCCWFPPPALKADTLGYLYRNSLARLNRGLRITRNLKEGYA